MRTSIDCNVPDSDADVLTLRRSQIVSTPSSRIFLAVRLPERLVCVGLRLKRGVLGDVLCTSVSL
jgi:hypothetical protein